MSRIGRLPIAIPAGVEVKLEEGNVITVKGAKGTLTRKLVDDLTITVENNEIVVTRPSDLKRYKSLHGLTRTLIFNMVVGVTEGYTKELEINGVGYRAAKSGNKLNLTLGYSHPVEMVDPEGVTTTVEGNNKLSFLVLIKKKLDSLLLKSDLNVHQSLTKVKVLNILLNTLDVKLVKQVRNNKGVRTL